MTYINNTNNNLKGATLEVSYTGSDRPCCVKAVFTFADGSQSRDYWDSWRLFESYCEYAGFVAA